MVFKLKSNRESSVRFNVRYVGAVVNSEVSNLKFLCSFIVSDGNLHLSMLLLPLWAFATSFVAHFVELLSIRSWFRLFVCNPRKHVLSSR
jgi:hypothetical protein